MFLLNFSLVHEYVFTVWVGCAVACAVCVVFIVLQQLLDEFQILFDVVLRLFIVSCRVHVVVAVLGVVGPVRDIAAVIGENKKMSLLIETKSHKYYFFR